mmetsp:Transcript_44532/g.112210  ORF Transcript_44532/g.112210 Transcript_44532/m.112210 type:complete len:222 (-) Transcript_44532:783-1448(-)
MHPADVVEELCEQLVGERRAREDLVATLWFFCALLASLLRVLLGLFGLPNRHTIPGHETREGNALVLGGHDQLWQVVGLQPKVAGLETSLEHRHVGHLVGALSAIHVSVQRRIEGDARELHRCGHHHGVKVVHAFGVAFDAQRFVRVCRVEGGCRETALVTVHSVTRRLRCGGGGRVSQTDAVYGAFQFHGGTTAVQQTAHNLRISTTDRSEFIRVSNDTD